MECSVTGKPQVSVVKDTRVVPKVMSNYFLHAKWEQQTKESAVVDETSCCEIPPAEIHQRLQRAYGSVCMGASSVRRWVKHFKDGKMEAIQKAVRRCLRMAGKEFYRRGIFKLPERWKKGVQRSGDYVEK